MCLVYSESPPGVTLNSLSALEFFPSFLGLLRGDQSVLTPVLPGVAPVPGPAAGTRRRSRKKFQARETYKQDMKLPAGTVLMLRKRDQLLKITRSSSLKCRFLALSPEEPVISDTLEAGSGS